MIVAFYSNTHARRGLALACLGITLAAFLLAFISVSDKLLKNRENLVASVIGKAAMIASQQDKIFIENKPKAAMQSLSILQADPHITAAFIATKKGNIVAKYIPRQNVTEDGFSRLLEQVGLLAVIDQLKTNDAIYSVNGKVISIYHPVMVNRNLVGVVYLESDLGDGYAALFFEIIMFVLIAMSTVLVSQAVSHVFTRKKH